MNSASSSKLQDGNNRVSSRRLLCRSIGFGDWSIPSCIFVLCLLVVKDAIFGLLQRSPSIFVQAWYIPQGLPSHQYKGHLQRRSLDNQRHIPPTLLHVNYIEAPTMMKDRIGASGRTMLQMSSRPSSPEDDALLWQQQAQKLRDEIEALEASKAKMAEEEQKQTQLLLDEKRDYLERYSATIPILKPDGTTVMESVTFPPRLIAETDNGEDTETPTTVKSSKIVVCEASLPLGMILGEHETLMGMTAVDEILKDSNAEKAGVQVGDLLRGVTACRMEMDTSNTWQLMAGGIGRPKTVRFMFSTDDEKFETVMEAVGSNRFDPQERPVVLVLERLE